MFESTAFPDFIRRIRAGDDQAVRELVERYEPVIRCEVRLRLAIRGCTAGSTVTRGSDPFARPDPLARPVRSSALSEPSGSRRHDGGIAEGQDETRARTRDVQREGRMTAAAGSLEGAGAARDGIRAARPRTHVASIANGFTWPGAAAFGPPGNIGNAAQAAVEGEQGQAEGRPQRAGLRHSSGPLPELLTRQVEDGRGTWVGSFECPLALLDGEGLVPGEDCQQLPSPG